MRDWMKDDKMDMLCWALGGKFRSLAGLAALLWSEV